MARCAWTVAACVALAISTPSARATVTSINPYGDSGGTERCLVGNGSDRCTKGGPYFGAYSITRLFSAWTGRSLTRIDDNTDKVWSAGRFGYIEVAGIAHYLSNHGTSSAGIWIDDGRFSASEFLPFPAGTEVAPPDNRTLGVVLPGEKVTADIVTGRAFDASFIAMTLGTRPFELVYRSRLTDGSVQYFSSDGTSRGFNNRVVSGRTLDHMVSWYAGRRIDGRHNTADTYLVAFERARQDDDFQDAVYAISIPVNAVPEPPVWAILALGFALTAWLRNQRSH